MGERFLWMLDQLRRDGVSMREIERKAGLGTGELSAYKGRFEKGNASIGAEKLGAICTVAGFSVLWVLFGSGDPRAPNVADASEIEASRLEVAGKLRGVYPDEVIELLLRMRIPVGAKAEASWWAQRATDLFRSWQDKTGPFEKE